MFHQDKSKPWVFWHTYYSRKAGMKVDGPYGDRNKVMKTLCKKAGVKYFRYHAMRHSGASVMNNANVPIPWIQKILGYEKRSTTEIYLHHIGDSERLAMSIYEQARQNPHTNPHTEKIRD